MDEGKVKKRRRLTLEEQAARIDEKERRLKEQKRELQKKLNAKKRRERTRRLIQLGAITQKYLGDDVRLSQYEQFLKALDSKPSEVTANIRIFIMRDEKKYVQVMDASGNPTGKIDKFARYKTLKSCFESFTKGDWFDFASHETKKQ